MQSQKAAASQQFPFLRQPNCPNEFKILMADRITSHHNYVAAHKQLFTATTPQQSAQAAQAVIQNYQLNQLIWAELKHYRDHGQILGKHPIWQQRKFMQQVKQLTVPEIIKKRNALYKAINDAKRGIKKADKPHLTAKRQQIIAKKTPLIQAIDHYLQSLK